MKKLKLLGIIELLILTSLVCSASQPEPLPKWALGPFVRPANASPIIRPNPLSVFRCPVSRMRVHWQALNTFNPAATTASNTVYLIYRAEDDTGVGIGGHVSRLGIAWSCDGIHFRTRNAPVVFPSCDSQLCYEWPGGCEDPRLVSTTDGRYVLTYTQWNRKTARLAVATSPDLVHWTKHGPAFAKALKGKYLNTWSKSGSIVSVLRNDKLVAAKIKGEYWMYWGEGDVCLAYSSNLKDWTIVEDDQGKPLKVLVRRPGRFDSDLTEAGPAAIATQNGILVLYNGKNSASDGDKSIGAGVYSAGQALFSANDPTKLLGRLNSPYFWPQKSFETTGQYKAGTTFTEGLTHFNGKWFLYYGGADSYVGVAVCQQVSCYVWPNWHQGTYRAVSEFKQ